LLLELAETEPLQSAYATLARLAIASNSLEQLHLVLHEMYDRGLRPSALVVKHAVRMACESDYPRLAYELAHRFEADSPHGKRLDSAAWASILIASAQSQYVSPHLTSAYASSKAFASRGPVLFPTKHSHRMRV
jgi:hypothetical protein